MIVYKDKSWCKSDCVNDKCSRCLTDKIRQEAEDFGLPYFAMVDFKTGCKDYKALNSMARGVK